MKIHFCLSWLCLELSFVFASGKKCFQCQDLPHPSDCRQIIDCADTDECFVDEFITGGGTVLYNTGCRPKQRCHGAGRRDIVARADIITCDECCVGELCNLQGCGQTAPSRNTRGPYCFACDAQSGETNCRTVKMCTTDQVCLIGYSETNQFYVTSCIATLQCATLQKHVHPAVPVGKRNSITFTKCSTCCTDDFCNNNCTHVVIPIDGHWSDWSHWTVCSATCDHGIKTRQRTCDNPQPQNNGKGCTGRYKMSTSCPATQSCHVTSTVAPAVMVNGHWSNWGAWSTCSTSCHKTRKRTCTNPAPQNHGNRCVGDANDVGHCHTHIHSHSVSNMTEDICHRRGYDWVNYECVIHGCLKLYSLQQEWNEGRKTCRDDGAELFIANHRPRQQLLEEYLRRHGSPFVWIGASTTLVPHTWQWARDTPMPLTYSKFHNHSVPTTDVQQDLCAVAGYWTNMYYWFPRNCYSRLRVLCEIRH